MPEAVDAAAEVAAVPVPMPVVPRAPPTAEARPVVGSIPVEVAAVEAVAVASVPAVPAAVPDVRALSLD